MARLPNLPIQQKLVLIAMVTTGGALLLAGAASVYFDLASFRRDMAGDLTTLADIVAQNSTGALTFHDPADAGDVLRSLQPQTSVVAAAVYDAQGRLFASFDRQGRRRFPPRPQRDGAAFVPGGLEVFRPVVLQGERIGTVYLRNSLDELFDHVRVEAISVGIVFLAAGILALFLSVSLQRLVSRPLLDLADTARAVSERRDYALRAAKRGADELGQLVDAFNDMLGQIQARDSELRRAKGELEERVRERTRELEVRNEELRQSNQELDDFAYIASHDLKEPLRGIHNFSSFLLEDYAGQLDDEGRSKLATLVRLSRRMEALIDSLLHFSRLGRVDLAMTEVDLNETVAQVRESLAISLQQENVEVRIPRPLPAVRCDRARVGEIFYNLILNAVKYNDTPHKWVEIGWTQDGQPGQPPVFYVRDNGIGIPEKHHDAVFRIFKRLHGRDQYGGGTGAGLTIVRKIVERHHGRIWLESSAGQGTTFYFTLEEGDPRA